MKKVLVFGAGGFVGKFAMAELARRSIEAVGISSEELRRPDTAPLAEQLARHRPHGIFQLAGLTRLKGEGFSAFYEGNVLPTARLAEALELAGVSAPVYLLGSAAELGQTGPDPVPESHPCRPHTHYGLSKHMQTELARLLRQRGGRFSVLRLFNVAGPGMSEQQVPLCFLKKLKAGEKKLESLSLEYLRDFIGPHHVARVLCDLFTAGWEGELINVCSGQGINSRRFVEAMRALGEFALEEKSLPSPGNYHNVGDPGLLRQTLGYVPEFSPEECVREIWSQL